MAIVQRINIFVSKIESWILVGIILLMVTMSFAQVVLRFFSIGLLWGDILLRHLVLWVGFIGASVATQEEKHINIDVLSRFFKKRGKLIAKMIVYLFAVYISWLLADAAWEFVMEEKEYETMLYGQIAAWPFQIIIPIGFYIMSLRFALLTIENGIAAITFKKGEAK